MSLPVFREFIILLSMKAELVEIYLTAPTFVPDDLAPPLNKIKVGIPRTPYFAEVLLDFHRY